MTRQTPEMKTYRILFLAITGFFLSLLLPGCESGPSGTCLQMEAASKQLETNLKMYESTWDQIINEGKIDMINETHFDKNITLVGSPENVVGIEDFRAYYNNFLVGFSNINFTIADLFGQDDNIVKHWRFKGTHTGEFFGIPATGNEVDVDGVTLVKMKDGKIAQEQDFFDNLVFMQQLGMIPYE